MLNAPGDLLVSDAERDRMISELTDHFQAGRLTKEEFDERSERALNARTRMELSAVLANLPPDPSSMAAPVAGPGGFFPRGTPAGGINSRLPAGMPRIWIILAIVIIALVVSSIHGHHSNLLGLAPVVVILLLILRRRAGGGRGRGYGGDVGWDDRSLRRDDRDLRRDDRRLRRDDRDLRREDRDLRRDDRDLRRDDRRLRRDSRRDNWD
jgi:hypothetical protein